MGGGAGSTSVDASLSSSAKATASTTTSLNVGNATGPTFNGGSTGISMTAGLIIAAVVILVIFLFRKG